MSEELKTKFHRIADDAWNKGNVKTGSGHDTSLIAFNISIVTFCSNGGFCQKMSRALLSGVLR
jgi:hypothetical protein